MTQKTSRRYRHDPNVANCDKISEKLSENRKNWLYRRCEVAVKKQLSEQKDYLFDTEDVASDMYYDLVDRRVEDVFPRGMPESDASWMAFLNTESKFAYMGHRRSAWRHPTESLDEEVSWGRADKDGDGPEVTWLDVLPDESKDEYRSRPEVRVELGLVREAVSLICKRRNYKPATCKVVELAFLEEASVADIARRCGMTANNISAIKFRFWKALCEDGPSVMAELERLSA